MPSVIPQVTSRTWIKRLQQQPGLIYAIWTVLWVGVAVGELLPGDSTPMLLISATSINDKVLHGLAYATLGFVPTFGLPLRKALLLVILAEILGIALEFAQRMVPGRSCDAADVIANTCGLAIGSIIGLLLFRLLMNGPAER